MAVPKGEQSRPEGIIEAEAGEAVLDIAEGGVNACKTGDCAGVG